MARFLLRSRWLDARFNAILHIGQASVSLTQPSLEADNTNRSKSIRFAAEPVSYIF